MTDPATDIVVGEPGCCNGLETWRDGQEVLDGTGCSYFGHDPSSAAEGRVVPSLMSHAPDIHRLEALSDRLVRACGQDSRGELPYRPAALMAERVGTELQDFPGGYTGLTTHPAEFGELPEGLPRDVTHWRRRRRRR